MIEPSILLTMSAFALSMSISPGPVNMVIVASGAHHGVWRTLPFVSGATLGFTALLLFIGFWFGRVMEHYPVFFKYLGVAGCLFIGYVGYKIALAAPDLSIEHKETPRFIQGVLLQWLNPKAWIACASGIALFAHDHKPASLLVFAMLYCVICYGSLTVWAVLGDKASRLLNSPSRIRAFNTTMGALLMGTAIYMLPL